MILEAIKESFYMLDLKEGWDEDKAQPIDPLAFGRAIEFLSMLHNTSPYTILAPEINPCPNGTVDLSWRSENGYRLLINVKPRIMSWYGDNGSDDDKINDGAHSSFCPNLAFWIRKNFKA